MQDPNLTAFFDRVAGSYDAKVTPAERQARARSLERLDVRAGEMVLDVGCGTGADLAAMARVSGRGMGVDASPKMLELARGRLDDLGLRDVGLEQRLAPPLPLEDDSVDAACCAFTLELQPLPRGFQLLQEIRRVLRPGGRLGLVGLSAVWPDPLGLSVSASGWLDRYAAADHDAIDWKTMLGDAGLAVRHAERTEIRELPADVLTAERQADPPPLPSPAACVKSLQSRQPLERIRGRQRLCLHGAESLDLLTPLLGSRKEAVRAEAAKCLGWIGDPRSVDLLVDALEDRSQKVRWIAAEGLTAMGEPGGRAVVARLTRPCEDTHRLYGSAGHVIRNLHRRGEQGLADLVEALEQSEPQAAVPVAASKTLRP